MNASASPVPSSDGPPTHRTWMRFDGSVMELDFEDVSALTPVVFVVPPRTSPKPWWAVARAWLRVSLTSI